MEKLGLMKELRKYLEELKTLNGQRMNVSKQIQKHNSLPPPPANSQVRINSRKRRREKLVNKLSNLEKQISHNQQKIEKTIRPLETIEEEDETKKLSQTNLKKNSFNKKIKEINNSELNLNRKFELQKKLRELYLNQRKNKNNINSFSVNPEGERNRGIASQLHPNL